ncbi:MAG: hypothetical protein P8X74_16605 [Reinekea sp.]
MTKQVNLLKEDMLKGFGPVQLPVFVSVALFSILCAVAWFYYNWEERQELLAGEQIWIAQLADTTKALENFKKQHPSINNENALKQKNDELLKELQRIQETEAGLSFQLDNAIDGFYSPLMQLSNYDLNGLWLNRITLNDGNRLFTLDGYSRDPSLIPQYIDQLGQSTFGNLSIQTLNMARQDKNLWQFTLSNKKTADTAGKKP